MWVEVSFKVQLDESHDRMLIEQGDFFRWLCSDEPKVTDQLVVLPTEVPE